MKPKRLSKLPVLDLTEHHFKRTHANITVYGAWYGQDNTPCLVLIRTDKQTAQAQTKPCVVLQHNAWIWDTDMGDPRQAAHTSTDFLRVMDMDVNALAAQRIAGIIHDHLGDLLKMPPKPKRGEVVADAIITNRETGKTRHAEILH